VEAIRGHLAPIGSLESLAESFAREATTLDPVTGFEVAGADLRDRLVASPLLVAYVVRWIELRDGMPIPAWRAVVEAGRLDG
jgi:hypothetical protein